MAAFAVLVLLAHLLFAQLTFVLAVAFAAVSKTTRWRLWWLAAPAAAGLAWTLVIGPRAAAAGFAAGPAQVLGYLTGGHQAGRLLHPHGAFAGAGGWLLRQFPLALIAAAAEAVLVGWLDWVHTDEWTVRPPRPGALAAARGALSRRATRAGAVVTRDGCVLGVAPGNGGRVVLGWQEIAGGILVTGADARTLAVSSLQVVHAALRRRKPLLALDLTGEGALAGALGAACAATGTPLRAAGRTQDGTDLARVVRERSAALLSVHTPDVAAQVCAGIAALGADLRRIGVDGDGLVWLYGYEPLAEGALGGTVASIVAGGAAAGLPVLVTTTSPRAVAHLAGLVSAVLVHRLADPAAADILAARTGTKLVPAGLSAWGQVTGVPPAVPFGQVGSGQPGAAPQPGAAVYPTWVMPPAAVTGQAGLFQPSAPQPGQAVPPAAVMAPAAAIGQAGFSQPPAALQYAAMPQQAVPAAASALGLVPAPAVPARTLLTLGPDEFVLAVSSPRYRLVKLGRAVPARLPRGAVL